MLLIQFHQTLLQARPAEDINEAAIIIFAQVVQGDRFAMETLITTSLILEHLPQIVSEHRALVNTIGLHNVIKHRASFLLAASDTESVSIPDARIGEIFDSYLLECKKQKSYDVAVATALCANVRKMHIVHSMVPLLASKAFEEVLQVLTKRGHWSLVLDFVKGRPDAKLHNLLREAMHASAVCTNPKLEECLELLLMRCSDRFTLKWVAERLILECRGAALAKLMTRDDVDLAQFWFYDTNGWPLNMLGLVAVCLVSENRARNRNPTAGGRPQSSSGYRSLLVGTIEAGLTSQQTTTCQHEDDTVPFPQRPTPLVMSAFNDTLDLVKLFYQTGATTNKELFRLRTHKEFTAYHRQVCDRTDSTSRQEVVDYISRAVSHPRRLQDLCAFKISQCIGCRSDRTKRVGKLPVSSVLRDAIFFKDALWEYLV